MEITKDTKLADLIAQYPWLKACPEVFHMNGDVAVAIEGEVPEAALAAAAEASSGEHSNLSTIGFVIGFVLMMVLDVVMG